MERVRRLLRRQQSYEPLNGDSTAAADDTSRPIRDRRQAFSVTVYLVFMLLGIAMLWAWNMSVASIAPLNGFGQRYSANAPLQATELSVSTVTNLGSVFVLAKLQANASYPKRIGVSLIINIVCFTLLAISTRAFLGVSPASYFAFLIVMILATSLATGFMQNGTWSYVGGYGRSQYNQSIMFGQAVAGVLPPISQIATVLSASRSDGDGSEASSTSAFAYFMTATGVSVATLLAFLYLATYHAPRVTTDSVVDNVGTTDAVDEDNTSSPGSDTSRQAKSVPLLYLGRRLLFSAAAVFLTFAITMIFPVFTEKIRSTNPDPPPILRDAAFIPLGLLVWNVGDLLGRMLPLVPSVSLAERPRILFALSVARIVFVPMYLLCNIQQPESTPDVISATRLAAMPDVFYLLIVQFPFGLSNGFLGSCCMMSPGDYVEEGEREAAGGFMSMVLVAGLAVGSVCSFFVGNA